MRRFALVFLLLCAFGLAACGESSVAATPTDTSAPAATTAPSATATTATSGGGTGGATIGLGVETFTRTSVTIKAGQSVTFNDPSDTGNVHDLVTGTNGQFSAAAGAPSEFASADGLTLSPGDTKAVVFPKAGTFTITCTFHPNMEATITVTA
ncbi:MAG TPA: plastocyanin/azurin family copper-binding protein [Ktedonobacterales bacterium]|nr:plastocyanin/azurin family copper-binding protein [Ktedonobacterales bacterium]